MVKLYFFLRSLSEIFLYLILIARECEMQWALHGEQRTHLEDFRLKMQFFGGGKINGNRIYTGGRTEIKNARGRNIDYNRYTISSPPKHRVTARDNLCQGDVRNNISKYIFQTLYFFKDANVRSKRFEIDSKYGYAGRRTRIKNKDVI